MTKYLIKDTKELWDKFLKLEAEIAIIKAVIQNENMELSREDYMNWANSSMQYPRLLSNLIIETCDHIVKGKIND